MTHRSLLASTAFTLATVLSLPAGAATKEPNRDVARIVQALAARGQLSAHDAQRLTRDALENGAGPHVPIARSPDGRIGCLSDAMRLVKTWAKGQGVELQSDPPASIGYVESATLPLRAYYQTEAQKSLAEEVLAGAETAWQNQVTKVGYPQPFTGDGKDPTPLAGLWLYVAPTGMGGGGYTEWLFDVPMTPISDCSARVVIDPENPSEVIGDVVAHEFNHTTQMATDCVEAISAWENFATAVETHYFTSYWVFQWFLDAFQKYPEYSIDFWGDPYGDQDLAIYQYGAALFPIYLKERFGDGDITFLRNIWYSFAQQGTLTCSAWGCSSSEPNTPNWFEGTEMVLKQVGSSFDEAYDEFAVWRAITGQRDDGEHFKIAYKYEDVALARTHSLVLLPVNGDALDVFEYGSRYIKLTPEGHKGQVHIKVTADPDAAWAGSLLLGRNGLPVERVPLAFVGADADVYVPSFSGVDWSILVVSQHSDGTHNPDDMEYETQRSFSYLIESVVPEPTPEPVPEAGPEEEDATEEPAPVLPAVEPVATDDGCGCRAAGRGSSGGMVAVALLALAASAIRRLAR